MTVYTKLLTPSAGHGQPSDARENQIRTVPILAILLLMTIARSSFANHYVVPSGSMEHSLMPGDRVVVDMMAYGLRVPFTDIHIVSRGTPQTGDVVVFDSPVDDIRLIKRVVAVSGDTVDLYNGHLTFNGVALRSDAQADVEVMADHTALLNLGSGGGPDIHGRCRGCCTPRSPASHGMSDACAARRVAETWR